MLNRLPKFLLLILLFSTLFLQTTTVLAQQYCILKADDFSEFTNDENLKIKYQNFINTIKEKNIVASIGLIGKTLTDPSDAFISYVKDLNNSKQFEFWNHGFDHGWNKNDAEFKGKSYEYQYGKMKKAQDIVKEKFGITMHSFGAPGNNIDSTTAVVIKDILDIKTWMYNGNIDAPQGVLGLPLRTNIENSKRVVSLPSFIELYEKNPNKEYMLSQLHPHRWSADSLVEFGKIIDYLKSKNTTFILPYDYYKIRILKSKK